MSEPTKNNDDILSNHDEFQAAYQRARAFFKQFPGVVDVAFGQKQTGGSYKDDISIVVFVTEKKAEKDVPADQRIPASFEGYPTDVRVITSTKPHTCDDSSTYSTIKGGIQIANPFSTTTHAISSGTLGCIVRKRNDTDRENVRLLSNKHVLFAQGGRAGDYIYHPWSPVPSGFASPGDSNSLGPVEATAFYGDVSYTPPGATTADNFFIDCATALINIDCTCLGTHCTKDVVTYNETINGLQVNGSDSITDVRSLINDASIINHNVFKVGRTTGKTTGIVRLVNAPIQIHSDPDDDHSSLINVHNTIQIDFDTSSTHNGLNCKGAVHFSELGDSGSLIVDEQGRAVGLISMGPAAGDPPGPDNSCHILPILDMLGICIPTTTGTSHGSTRATDGSGLAAAPTTPLPGVTGAASVAGGSTRVLRPDGSEVLLPVGSQMSKPVGSGIFLRDRLGLFQPEPVTEKQQERLTALLNAFRSSPEGRELHGAFAHVRREIGYLVRHRRPITVAWQRHKGPAFFAALLNHLRGETDHFPHQIGEHHLATLLDKLGPLLSTYGSNPLRETIDRHGQTIRQMLLTGNTAEEFISHLTKMSLA